MLASSNSQTNQSEPVAEFKLVLLGIDGSGKTSYVSKFKSSQESRSTENYKITPLTFFTTIGPVKLNIWDVKSEDSFQKCKDEFLNGADCAILLFDVTSRFSYKNIPVYHKELTERTQDAAVVLAGNKVDELDRKVKPKHIIYHRKRNLTYYDICVKSNYQLEKPFLTLLRLATQQSILDFVEVPNLNPPELTMTPEFLKKLEYDQQETGNAPLPADDDDDI